MSDDRKPVAAFRAELRDLYAAVGSPSYRQLSKRVPEGLSHGTIGHLLNGKGMPRWDSVKRFVRACQKEARAGGRAVPAERFDLNAWQDAYDRLRAAADRGGRPSARYWFGVVPRPATGAQRRAAVDRQAILGAGATTVLTGLGGVGKTQLAGQLVREAWAGEHIDLLIWIGASTRDSILAGYHDPARDVADVEAADPVTVAERFLAWLTVTDLRWLIVFDDLVNPGDLAGLWPSALDATDGRVLVTTRRADAALHGDDRRVLPIGPFTADEALAYVTARLVDRPALADDAAGLAADLAYLPLALAQATAYLLDRSLTCGEYRARFADARRRLDEVMPEPGGLPDDQRATVAAMWVLSIDQADALTPVGVARPVIELASLFASDPIPQKLFLARPALDYLTTVRSAGVGARAAVDAADAQDGLHCLARLSLLTVNPGSPGGPGGSGATVSMHGLVQRATRDLLPTDRAGAAVRAAADAVLGLWPEVERDPVAAQVLRAHATALVAPDPDGLWQDGAHPLLFRLGAGTGVAGDNRAATGYFERLAGIATRRLHADHPSALLARHEAIYWRGQGTDPAGAASAAPDLISDLSRVLGPDHPDTLAARVYLPRWLGLAGDPGAAEAALRHLLPELERVLGPEHESTLTARNDRAHFQCVAGDPAGAAEAFAELYADRLRLLGADHPHTLTTRNDRYLAQGQAGDPAAAVAGYRELVPDLARVLGREHPNTLAARGSLARWQGEAGDPAAAVRELTGLVIELQRVVGPEHKYTLRTHEYLAEWQRRADEFHR